MRKLTTAVAAAALATTLAACSSSGSGDHNSPSAPPATGGSGTSSATGGGETGGGESTLDAAQFVALATAATEKAQTVKLKEKMTLLGAPITASGAARFGDETADARVTSTTPMGPIQVIVVDGDVYMKGLGQGTPDRPWVKNAGESQQIANALKKADPRETLPMLGTVGTLKPVGTQTINGVAATHYSVTVDLAEVAKQNPDLAKLVNEAIQAGVKVQDVQVWVDAQKRPVRLATSAQLPNPAGNGKKITIAQTVDYSDWGAPVTITAPPADQVTEK